MNISLDKCFYKYIHIKADQERHPPRLIFMSTKMNSFDPFWFWNDTQLKLAGLLHDVKTKNDFPIQIETLARFIYALIEKDPDSGIGAMLLLDSNEYPVAHMIHVAII